MLEPFGPFGWLRWKDPDFGTIQRSTGGAWCLTFAGTGRVVTIAKLVWLRSTGEWPTHSIRRRNGNVQDDRFENLILAGQPNTPDVSDLV